MPDSATFKRRSPESEWLRKKYPNLPEDWIVRKYDVIGNGIVLTGARARPIHNGPHKGEFRWDVKPDEKESYFLTGNEFREAREYKA